MDENNRTQSNEKTLIDYLAIIWRYKVMIIIITMVAAIGSVVNSVTSIRLPNQKSPMPDMYTSNALMLIDNKYSSSRSSEWGVEGLSSPSYGNLAVLLIGTYTLHDAVVEDFYALNGTETSAREDYLHKVDAGLKATFHDRSGVLTISYTDTDPILARDITNYCAEWLGRRFEALGLHKGKIELENLEENINKTSREIEQLENETRRIERSFSQVSVPGSLPAIYREIDRIVMELNAKRQVYTQLKVQYEMLKIGIASEQPVIQILETANIPKKVPVPSWSRICKIVTLAGFLFAVILALAIDTIIRIKNDPVAVAKFRRKKYQ